MMIFLVDFSSPKAKASSDKGQNIHCAIVPLNEAYLPQK